MRDMLHWGGKFCCFFALLLAMSVVGEAQGGETSVYVKSGYFTWDETFRGSSFVSEKGFLYAAGAARKDAVGPVTLSETLEVWGGNPDYTGKDVTNTFQVDSDTSYLGTKEEFAAGVPLRAGILAVEPFAAVGHRFWIRTRSSEDWNTVYGKAGAGAAWRAGRVSLFARGGAMLPLYTRTHVALSDEGFSDVTIEPKGRVTPFAEGGVSVGALSFSVEYEELSFGESDKVATSRLAGTQGGVAIVNSEAFQPRSKASLVSLKASYTF